VEIVSASGSGLLVTINDGTRTYDFYSTTSFQMFMDFLKQPSTPQSDLSPCLEEFKGFPQVDPVLLIYFSESMINVQNKHRLAPSILIGCLSELLIIRLVKTIGDFLGDPNAVITFKEKRKDVNRQCDYTKELVRKARGKLLETETLTTPEEDYFRKFPLIVAHMMDSIKLRRNECVHPEPEMTLDDMPTEDVARTHFQAFNPYAEIILNLVALFKRQPP
jgi:hypothetical protein